MCFCSGRAFTGIGGPIVYSYYVIHVCVCVCVCVGVCVGVCGCVGVCVGWWVYVRGCTKSL